MPADLTPHDRQPGRAANATSTHEDCVSMLLFKWVLGVLTAVYISVLTIYVIPEIRELQREKDERLMLAERSKWEMETLKQNMAEVKNLAQSSVVEVNKLVGRISQCSP